ncbi:hypothetical protein C0992_006730 [Termitomyces sp. T32_za158]|nr:hypothetical protein C0992_006730 [Termitomyces sp. T32_za158]
MAPPSAVVEPPKHYWSILHKILANALCWPYRLKKKCVAEKKTAADKRKAAKKRCSQHESYKEARQAAVDRLKEEAIKLHAEFGGHSVQWFKEDILQVGCLKTKSRGPSQWNALLHVKAKCVNQDNSENPMKAHKLAALLKEKWKSMSKEEKIALTDSLIKELKEHRDSVSHGKRNVHLESFADTRQCLLALEAYLSTRFEAYCLSGVEGIVNKQTSTTIELRSRLKDIINGELESMIGKLINCFRSPSKLMQAEVNVLLGAWTTKTTYFHKMDQEEWKKWRVDRFAMDTATPEEPSSSPNTSSSSPNTLSAVTAEESPIEQEGIHIEQDTPPLPQDNQANNSKTSCNAASFMALTPGIFINMIGLAAHTGTMITGVKPRKKKE